MDRLLGLSTLLLGSHIRSSRLKKAKEPKKPATRHNHTNILAVPFLHIPTVATQRYKHEQQLWDEQERIRIHEANIAAHERKLVTDIEVQNREVEKTRLINLARELQLRGKDTVHGSSAVEVTTPFAFTEINSPSSQIENLSASKNISLDNTAQMLHRIAVAYAKLFV